MNNIGEYTGDADDVLNRHESCYDRRGMLIQGDYHPISYPDWSDNQWKGVWHRYSKYLNDAKRKELSEQQAQQARDARENLRIEQLRNTLQLRVSYLIGQIVQKKEVQHTKYIKDKENRAFAAQYGSGNSKKAMELIKYNRNAFAECSNNELIWLYFVFTVVLSTTRIKAQRSNAVEILAILDPLMHDNSISTKKNDLQKLFELIPPDIHARCRRVFTQGIITI